MRPGSAPGQAPCRLPTWYRCCASSGEASSVTCCSMNSLNVSGVDFFMCLQPTGAGGGTEWAAAVGLTAAPRRHCACPRPIPHQTTADAEHAVATPMTCWAAQPLAGTDGAAACPVLASGGGGGRLAARWLPARTRCAAPGGRRGRPVHGLVVAPIVAWLAVGVAIAVAVVVAAVAAVGAAKAVVWGVAPAPPGRRVRAVTAARGAAGAGGRRSGCLSRTRAVQAAVQQLPADRRGTAVVGGVGAGTWHPNVLGGLAPMRAARVPCGGGWPAAPAQWRCTH